MICNCGSPAKQKVLHRGNLTACYWACDTCGRELAEGKAADMLNERFTPHRLGWYQDTLHPLAYLKTRTRMYNLCLLRHSARYIPTLPNAEKYLHGLIRADGGMFFYSHAQEGKHYESSKE